MTTASNATVVCLHSHPAWAAAQRRQRDDAIRRHPSSQSPERSLVLPAPVGPVAQLAVVHEIGARRAKTAAEHADVDEIG